MSGPWQPLDVCAIKDPLQTSTCIGATSRGNVCACAVSRNARQDARSKLETLGRIPLASEEVRIWLRQIASLLLCKRWHQGQASSIAQKWQRAVDNMRSFAPAISRDMFSSLPVGAAGSGEGHTEDRDIEAPERPAAVSPRQPAGRRPVSPAALEQNAVAFTVSTTRLASLEVLSSSGEVSHIILRSFRCRPLPPMACSICHDSESPSRVVVTCEECSCDFHLTCMVEWLSTRSTSTPHTCPYCREIRTFDGLYIENPPQPSTEPLTREPNSPTGDPQYPVLEPATSSPSPVTTSPPPTVTSDVPALRQGGSWRSSRVRRRPDYYVPS
ncbi:RING finger protein [Aspergillus lucknowensis]|uniref:RING-type domain-containing protein n=1 Tax=Aspergillus lucknowensis TaxID=176173 RepID=A0ABR4L3J1_9EURO